MATRIDYFDYLDDIVLNGVHVKDIYKRLDFIYQQMNSNEDLLLDVRLNDEVSPEDIALRLYKNKLYYWIVLLVNEVQDYFYDWLLDYNDLKNLAQKYWDDGIHFEYTSVDQILEYLTTKNEEKRNIKVLNPVYLNEFLDKANSAVGG